MRCVNSKNRAAMRSVTVEKPDATADAAGHVDLSLAANWTTVCVRRASIQTRGGSESRRWAQVHADTTHIVDMRSDATTRTIHPRWRLKLGTRNLDIVAAYDVDDARETVRCECVEQLP